MGTPRQNTSSRVMTVPEEITDHQFIAVTGNDFVSLPEIDTWGRILSVTFLHAGCAGLIELRGARGQPWGSDSGKSEAEKVEAFGGSFRRPSPDDGRARSGPHQAGENRGEPTLVPFMAPMLVWNGKSVDLTDVSPEVTLNGDWVPEFSWVDTQSPYSGASGDVLADGGPGWKLSVRIVAPPEEKGFCYILSVQNLVHESAGVARGAGPGQTTCAARAEVGVELTWAYTGIRLFASRELPVVHRCRYDRWTRSVVAEALGPLPVFGLALNSSEDLDRLEIDGEHGRRIIRASKSMSLAPGERATVGFYVAFNREADGARTTGVHLRRLGWQALEAATHRWLAERRSMVPGMPREESVLNRNLLFNYFFATGKTIDSEQLVAVTSRSPRYYVSAAFWSRDALLWSLPALVIMDRVRAREVLLYALSVGTMHAGDHAQYIDGRVLYPGFELDEAAAYLVGLGTYLDGTSDFDILKEPVVFEGIKRVLAAIEKWLLRTDSGEPVLCRTLLDPSDDPVASPFLAYDNALLRRGLLAAAEALDRLGRQHEELARKLRQDAESLGEAIRRYCVVDGPFGPMYAWAVDLGPCGAGGSAGGDAGRLGMRRTGVEVYDDPPGSLELLGLYGCCRDDEGAAILANTRRWIHSHHNPHFIAGCFGGPGSAHSLHPWPMSAANVILAEAAAFEATGRCDLVAVEGAIRFHVTAPMDGGLACETVDRDTGRVETGAAFATGAGFVAYGMWRGLKVLNDCNTCDNHICVLTHSQVSPGAY